MQLTIRQWFRKYAKLPVLVATSLVVLAQLIYAGYSIHVSQVNQESSLQRIVDIVALGVAQQNRTLIESALGVGLAELNASSIALCKQDRPIISLPTDVNACTRSEARFGYRTKNAPLLGMPGYSLHFEVPWIENAPFFFVTLLFGGVFLLAAYSILARMQRRLKKDIFDPLTQNIADLDVSGPCMKTDTNVKEISQLYGAYIDKIQLLQLMSAENAKNAQMVAIAQTAQMVAHDVRRPFSLMKMFLNAIKNHSPEKIKSLADDHICDLEDAIHAATEMMSDILDCGAESVSKLETVRPGVLLQKILQSYSEVVLQKQVQVGFDCDCELLIRGDDRKLSRALQNLVGNAFDAVCDGGRIHLSLCSASPAELKIEIYNSGSYIAPERREDIFHPFVSVGKKNGTGLGLAIVKKVIEGHGGRVSISSNRSPDETIFAIHLPTIEGAEKERMTLPAEVSAQVDESHLPEISLVDDETIVHRIWKMETKDAIVNTFRSPEAFFERVNSEPEFLSRQKAIVTDMCFKKESKYDGIEFAEKLRKQYGDSIFIATNGKVDQKNSRQFIRAVLPKEPVSFADLKSMLS